MKLDQSSSALKIVGIPITGIEMSFIMAFYFQPRRRCWRRVYTIGKTERKVYYFLGVSGNYFASITSGHQSYNQIKVS